MGLFDFGGLFGGGGGGGGSGGTFGTGGSESTTQTADQKVAASEGSLAVGAGGKFLEGTDLSGASNVTITQVPDAAAGQTISDLATGLTSFLQKSNENALSSQKTSDDLLKEVLTKLTEKDTAQATGFQSLLISPLFWLGIAGLGVLGIFLWRKA